MRIPRCALGICMLYLHLIVAGKIGAEEGTRPPTPLRVHGPEPCPSANSATSASDHVAGRPTGRLDGRDYAIYSTGQAKGVKPWAIDIRRMPFSRRKSKPGKSKPRRSKPRKPAAPASPPIDNEQVKQLRLLAHDLSNALEAILQACYLLNRAKARADTRRWSQLIDSASQDAGRITREIRLALR